MKRLIDDPDAAFSSKPLADLVRHAEPFRPNPFRKRLLLSRVRTARSRSFRFRFGPALAVALIGTATASAAVGYKWIKFGSPVEASRGSAVPIAPGPARAIAPSRQQQPMLQSVPALSPARESAAEPAKLPGPGTASRPAGKTSAAAADKALSPGEDPAPVLEAIRALRKSGDPERAQKLLDQYLASHPRGALSEDALGLAMEAAAARRDPRAAEYARRYLARFPKGRFRAMAHKALARQ